MAARAILDEKLIECVRKHTVLYDTDAKDYTDNNFKLKIWRQIAQKCGISSAEVAKKQWKNLRDGYRTSLKMYELNKNEDPLKKVKKWKHFHEMSFLRPYMKVRSHKPSSTSINGEFTDEDLTFDESSQDIMKEEMVDDFDIPSTFIQELDESRLQEDGAGPSKKQCLRLNQDLEEMSKDIEWIQQEQSESSKDCLKLFFDSMYASTKKLPPRLQRVVKTKLFQAVNDAEAEDEQTNKTVANTDNQIG